MKDGTKLKKHDLNTIQINANKTTILIVGGNKMDNKKFTPFSKKNVIYARLEAYIFSLILIVMVWMDKDVSAIAILLSLAWAGYKGLQCFYLWLCKHEHLMDRKIEYKKLGLDASDIDTEMEELENENFEESED